MRRFEKMNENAILPKRGTKFSAGYDFYIPNGERQEYIIEPHETEKIQTGIRALMNPDEYLEIVIRSSMGIKKNLKLANGTGIIDSDYYGNKDNGGNIILAIHNYGNEVQIVKSGDRVAQGIFHKFLITDDDETDSERDGGIGSTGK